MIKRLIMKKHYNKAYLEIIKLHPYDQANILSEQSEEIRNKLLSYYKDHEMSELLSYLDPDLSSEVIKELSDKRKINVFSNMEIDDAVDLIENLDDEFKEDVLSIIENKDEYDELLKYNDNEAGSLMTSDFILVSANMDVKEATKILIKKAPEVERISTLFVVDEAEKYVGTISLNKLIKTKSPYLVKDLLMQDPAINAYDDIDMTIHLMREYSLTQLAVCDDNGLILGIITLDDVIEAYNIEAKEDFEKLSAVNNSKDKSVFKSAFFRLPWLVILLLTSIPIALASSMFEEIILTVSILALFQPLILDASGDVATQTLAVTLRQLNKTNEAKLSEGLKEILAAAINGVILGIVSGVITFFMAIVFKMDNPILVGLVIGLSLLLTVIIGPIFGFLIPVILNKLKIDPAVASGPFITTLVDIMSLVIYFGLASLMLGGVLNG